MRENGKCLNRRMQRFNCAVQHSQVEHFIKRQKAKFRSLFSDLKINKRKAVVQSAFSISAELAKYVCFAAWIRSTAMTQTMVIHI